MPLESQQTILLLLKRHLDSNKPICCYSFEPKQIPSCPHLPTTR